MTERLETRMGEVVSPTEQRLIRYGCTEREARVLATAVRVRPDASDAECENAVINALVDAKQTVDGISEVEYLSGQRRDTLRRA
jgi:hypothetical protein